MIKVNQKILDKGRKYSGLRLFLGNNTTPILAYAPFNDRYIIFKSENDTFLQKVAIISADNSGTFKQKTKDKHTASNTFGGIAGTGKAYAIATGKGVLEGQMDWTKAKVFNEPDQICLGTQKAINDSLRPLIGDVVFDTYGITTAILDAAMLERSTSSDSMGAVKAAIATINAAKKYIFETSIPDTEGTLKEIDRKSVV